MKSKSYNKIAFGVNTVIADCMYDLFWKCKNKDILWMSCGHMVWLTAIIIRMYIRMMP